MSTEDKKEPLLFLNESRVGLPPKWDALKIAEASIPMVVALNLTDDQWYEIKLSVKKRPEETMLCRFVGVNVLSEDPFANENFYPVFKLNSSDSFISYQWSSGKFSATTSGILASAIFNAFHLGGRPTLDSLKNNNGSFLFSVLMISSPLSVNPSVLVPP